MDKKLLNKIKSDFEFLKNKGFKNSKNKYDQITSKFSWVQENIGIEIEIDLRDFSIYLLVVKVKNYHLPGGYYMYGGERVRDHLQFFLTRNNIIFDKKTLEQIQLIYKKLQNNRSENLLLELSDVYATLLKSVCDELVKNASEYRFGDLKT